MKRVLKYCSLLLLLSPMYSYAQGTITDGSVSATVNSFSANGISMSTSGIGGGDQLFETGFWFRYEQDTQENPVHATTPDSQSYIGDQATLTWNDVGGFSAEIYMEIMEGAVGQAQIISRLVLTSLNGAGSVDVFYYSDPDMDGSVGGDSAYLFQDETVDAVIISDQTCMGVFAASTNSDPFTTRTADAFQVTPWPLIRNELNDAGVTDLDNSGLPIGPADVTVAFQMSGDTPSATQAWYGAMIFWSRFDPELPDCEAVSEPLPVPGPGPIPLALLAMLMLGGAWHFRGRFV